MPLHQLQQVKVNEAFGIARRQFDDEIRVSGAVAGGTLFGNAVHPVIGRNQSGPVR